MEVPRKPEQYIVEFIKATHLNSPSLLGALKKFMTDPTYSMNLKKIMDRAHTEILQEWRSFKDQERDLFPPLEESSAPQVDASSETPFPQESPQVTTGSHAVDDQYRPGDTPSAPPQQSPALAPSLRHQVSTPPEFPTLPRQMPAAPSQAGPSPSRQSGVASVSSATVAPVPVAPIPTASVNVSFRLQNAMVGVQYASNVETTTPNVPDIAIVKVDGLAEVGLYFDSTAMKVVGSPSKSGDFVVVVWFSKMGESAQIPSKCNLTINPDPKSLWQNTPSDQNGLYAKPDEDKSLITSPDHILVGASKRGRSHAHTGIYRDDDFYIGHVEETGWDISIISDGAGSCKYSRRGSELICKGGGERLHHLLSGDNGKQLTDVVADYKAALDAGQAVDAAEIAVRNALWTTIGYAVHHATKRLQDEMTSKADLKAVMKDYSSTAIFGIAKKFSFGTLCAAYWVGDGAVAVMKADGTHILLGEADGGEYSGQTRFLGPEFVKPEELAKRLRFALVPDFKALMLMTDGVSDPYFETDSGLNNPGKWNALWEELDTSVELSMRGEKLDGRLLLWLDFWSAGNHDDRTLTLIY